MEAKPFYQSSTFWINMTGIVAVALDMVLKLQIIPDADVIAIVTAILNILNRMRVSEGSEVKPIKFL